jgi:hypothetical protein
MDFHFHRIAEGKSAVAVYEHIPTKYPQGGAFGPAGDKSDIPVSQVHTVPIAGDRWVKHLDSSERPGNTLQMLFRKGLFSAEIGFLQFDEHSKIGFEGRDFV